MQFQNFSVVFFHSSCHFGNHSQICRVEKRERNRKIETQRFVRLFSTFVSSVFRKVFFPTTICRSHASRKEYCVKWRYRKKSTKINSHVLQMDADSRWRTNFSTFKIRLNYRVSSLWNWRGSSLCRTHSYCHTSACGRRFGPEACALYMAAEWCELWAVGSQGHVESTRRHEFQLIEFYVEFAWIPSNFYVLWNLNPLGWKRVGKKLRLFGIFWKARKDWLAFAKCSIG